MKTNKETKMNFKEKNQKWVEELSLRIEKIQADIDRYEEAFNGNYNRTPHAKVKVTEWKKEVKNLKFDRAQWKKYC